jgi:hypothetical protein
MKKEEKTQYVSVLFSSITKIKYFKTLKKYFYLYQLAM